MTKTNLFTPRGGGDHIADLNLFSRDDNPINQQLDELTFLFKRRLSQPLLYALTECFHRLHHSSELIMMPYIRFELPLLFGNNVQTLLQFEPPPLVFFQLQHIGKIRIG